MRGTPAAPPHQRFIPTPSPYAPYRYTCSVPPALHTSMLLRSRIRNTPPELHTFIPLRRSAFRDTVAWCSLPLRSFSSNSSDWSKPHQTPSKFHACTPAVCLQSSRARLLSSRSIPSARLQRASAVQYLHVAHTYSAHPELPSSIPPHRHARSVHAELRTAYLSSSISTHLYRASLPPVLYAYTPAARLPPSIPSHIHARSASLELPSSIR